MTTKSYKQIVEAIESGKRVAFTEKQHTQKRTTRYSYTVSIDGTEYGVSAASWNKLNKNHSLRTIDTNSYSSGSHFFQVYTREIA